MKDLVANSRFAFAQSIGLLRPKRHQRLPMAAMTFPLHIPVSDLLMTFLPEMQSIPIQNGYTMSTIEMWVPLLRLFLHPMMALTSGE